MFYATLHLLAALRHAAGVTISTAPVLRLLSLIKLRVCFLVVEAPSQRPCTQIEAVKVQIRGAESRVSKHTCWVLQAYRALQLQITDYFHRGVLTPSKMHLARHKRRLIV
jgi:hypothetical protein